MSRSRYDGIASKIVRKTIKKWKHDFNQNKEHSHFPSMILRNGLYRIIRIKEIEA